jgi:hypothetical protein
VEAQLVREFDLLQALLEGLEFDARFPRPWDLKFSED